MKNIIKDVWTCKSIRDGIKAIWVSIWIAVLERMIMALKWETKGGEEYASGMGVQQTDRW